MYIEKETDKAYLLVHNAVSFWVQKRWYKNGKLLPAGWKAFRDAEKKFYEHFTFDALKEFNLVRETEKEVLLRCFIKPLNSPQKEIQFWLPKSMTNNWDFVSKKLSELEYEYPTIAHIIWSGNKAA